MKMKFLFTKCRHYLLTAKIHHITQIKEITWMCAIIWGKKLKMFQFLYKVVSCYELIIFFILGYWHLSLDVIIFYEIFLIYKIFTFISLSIKHIQLFNFGKILIANIKYIVKKWLRLKEDEWEMVIKLLKMT